MFARGWGEGLGKRAGDGIVYKKSYETVPGGVP